MRGGLESVARLAPIFKQTLQNFGGFTQVRDFLPGELRDLRGEIFDAELASFMEEARALRRGANVQAAGVARVRGNFGQAAAGKAGNDAAHGGGLDLFGGGEFFQCFRSAENQNRKSGELCGANAGGHILFAHPAQQMDGSGVEAVGDGECQCVRSVFVGLDFGHRI